MEVRTAVLVGGPSDGLHPRMPDAVEYVCTRTPAGGGVWQLYRRADGDRYVHAGPCGHPHPAERWFRPRRLDDAPRREQAMRGTC